MEKDKLTKSEPWLPLSSHVPVTGRIPIDGLRTVRLTNPVDTFRFDALLDFDQHSGPFFVGIAGTFEGPNGSREVNEFTNYSSSPAGGRYWVTIGVAIWKQSEMLTPSVVTDCDTTTPMSVPFPSRARPSRGEDVFPEWPPQVLDGYLNDDTVRAKDPKTGRIPIDDVLPYVQVGNSYEFDLKLDFSDHPNHEYEVWAEATFTPQQQESPPTPEVWPKLHRSTANSSPITIRQGVTWHTGTRLDLKVFTKCLSTGMVESRLFSAVKRTTEPRPIEPPS